MKIVIEHKGVKRLIEGTGFNICASPEDLRTIADAIDREEMKGYGWMRIRDPQPDEHCAPPNTEPEPWSWGMPETSPAEGLQSKATEGLQSMPPEGLQSMPPEEVEFVDHTFVDHTLEREGLDVLLRNSEEALRHIANIMEEHVNEGEDLEIGSTDFKSVRSWAMGWSGWEGNSYDRFRRLLDRFRGFADGCRETAKISRVIGDAGAAEKCDEATVFFTRCADELEWTIDGEMPPDAGCEWKTKADDGSEVKK